MKFINRFKKDIEARQEFNGVVVYLFSNFDVEMINKIRNHSPLNTLFIFCQSPLTLFSYQNFYNKRINKTIKETGYRTNGIKQYNLDEIIDLEHLEKTVRKKYKSAYYRPMTYTHFGFRPFLKRYVIKLNENFEAHQEIVMYHVIFDPIAVLELLNNLNEQHDLKLRLGIAIREFDGYFGNAKLLQPQKKLMKEINPEFIISSKIFWYSNSHQKSHFQNWEGYYSKPIEMEDELVMGHRIDLAEEKEKELEDLRTMLDMGMINL